MTQSVNDEEVYNQPYKNNNNSPPERLWVYVCSIDAQISEILDSDWTVAAILGQMYSHTKLKCVNQMIVNLFHTN